MYYFGGEVMDSQFSENFFSNFDNKKDLLYSFLDSLPYGGAVLDKNGTIICINQKWKDMDKSNNSLINRQKVGLNYIKLICETENQDTKLAQKAASGIENVLTGKKEIFTLEYPCLTNEEKSWFKMKVKSFEDGALVLHEKIIGTAQNIAKLERKRKWAPRGCVR